MLSTTRILSQLSEYTTPTLNPLPRNPERIASLARQLDQRGWTNQTGETAQRWDVIEQAGYAFIETGNWALADKYANLLEKRFPDSPRVAILLATIMHAKPTHLDDKGKGNGNGNGKGSGKEEARVLLERVLEFNEEDINARKRLISLSLFSSSSSSPSPSPSPPTGTASSESTSPSALPQLLAYLETYYTDASGWSLLSTLYASLSLYPQSLIAQSHVLLLTPHSPFALLKHAETAYSAGETELACKEMERVVEICGCLNDEEEEGHANGVGGVGRRAIMGVLMCINKQRVSASLSTEKLARLEKMQVVMTTLLLEAYRSPGASGREVVTLWIGGN